MKFTKAVFLALVFAASTPSIASDQSENETSEDAQPAAATHSIGVGDVLAETVLRPVGFIATVIGTGLFLSFLPPVAINSIYEPHEPIKDWADLMIVNPAKFTFTRPIGDYRYPQTVK